MYRISKRFDFSAAHWLEGLPPDHQCARLHGHNYSVTVTLEAYELDEVGFIVDYGALDSFRKYLNGTGEHRSLNDVFDFNPTAENLAKHLFNIASQMFTDPLGRFGILSVEVKETEKTSAIYTEKI